MTGLNSYKFGACGLLRHVDADVFQLVVDIEIHLLLVAVVRRLEKKLVRRRRGKNRFLILQRLALPHHKHVSPFDGLVVVLRPVD